MTIKFTRSLTVLVTLILFIICTNNSYGQGLFDKLKKKTEDKIDKASNDILNGKKKKEKQNGTVETESQKNEQAGRPKFSELNEEDFIQNSQNPPRDTANTRFSVAKNLMIDIRGKYPNGYSPKWRFITYKSNLKYSREDWLRPKAQLYYEDRALAIGSYDGKAVIRIKTHFDCECYADIKINDATLLTQNSQVFELTNFRKILNERSTGEPCVGGLSDAAKGGWGGKIALSANINGDITMNIMMEDYTLPYTKKNVWDPKTKSRSDVFYPSQVNYRYNAKDVMVENEMSAEKAKSIIAAELEAKQKYADYVKKSEKQIEELMKTIKTKYPGFNCISCFSRTSSYGVDPTTTRTLWSDGAVTEDNDWTVTNTMKIENKCNQEITFIGIQQLYDSENEYTYKDVTRTMEAKYYYQAKQGLFMSIFTSMTGLDGDIVVQPEYNISGARVGQIQWIRVIGKKKP